MAPLVPEEVDVFTIPHSRMKQLVHNYCDQVSTINFSDVPEMERLLVELCKTFAEFKAHEQIENELIMKRLKAKLKALQITNSAVCNCHKDNKLSDMLQFIKTGLKNMHKMATEAVNYGLQLRRALDDFTENFLPHMKEEEEVFQPLLLKYFSYEELKAIKLTVIQEHQERKDEIDKYIDEEKDDLAAEKSDGVKDECIPAESVKTPFADLPPEVMMHIFSYLSPRDLCRCAQVNHQWNKVAMDGQMWKEIHPVKWGQGLWRFRFPEEADLDVDDDGGYHGNIDDYLVIDDDRDIDESCDSDSSCGSQSENAKQIYKEGRMLMGIARFLLPRVGHCVEKLDLANSRAVTSGLLSKMIKRCPNVQDLDLSNTRASDTSFKSFGKDGCGSKLRRLKLSGCATVTDFTLTRVAEAINNDKLKLDYDTCYCMNAINNRMRKWNECMKNMQSITGDIEEDKDLNSEKSMKKASICDECEERTSNCETKNKSVTYVETNISCETLETTYGTKSASKTGETDETNIEDVPGVACCRDKDTVMSAPNTNETVNTMEYLDLSGCYMITNNGLRALISNGGLPKLQYLDMSGCWNITAETLTMLVSTCPLLKSEDLYYCDNIVDGPYATTANGCQNVECKGRFCCRSGYM